MVLALMKDWTGFCVNAKYVASKQVIDILVGLGNRQYDNYPPLEENPWELAYLFLVELVVYNFCHYSFYLQFAKLEKKWELMVLSCAFLLILQKVCR